MDKRKYYTDEKVVQDYEHLRYAGPGGAYANQRELDLALDFIPPNGLVLDLPVGVGRLSQRLIARGNKVISLDYSKQMLTASRKLERIKVPVRGDAFNLPFADNSLDCVASLRFVFHYQEIAGYLKEIQRVLRPGGSMVFDTYTWSPFMFFWTPAWVGGRSYIHRIEQVRKLAEQSGFEISNVAGAFLCSPLLYRFSSGWFLQKLIDWEHKLAAPRRNVQFWKLTKRSK